MNENSPGPAVWNRTTSFRPSTCMRACLRACRKTAKNGYSYQQHPRPRHPHYCTERKNKYTPLCARSDPPHLPSPRSLRKQEPHVPRSSRNLRTHVHVHTPTHKQRNTCEKNTCVTKARRIPLRWLAASGNTAPPLFLLYSTFCLALRRRGTISCA